MSPKIRLSAIYGGLISLALINISFAFGIFSNYYFTINLSVLSIFVFINFSGIQKGLSNYVLKLCNYSLTGKVFFLVLFRYLTLHEFQLPFLPSPDVLALNEFAKASVSQHAHYWVGFFHHPSDPGIWVIYHIVYSLFGKDAIFIQLISLLCSTLIIIYTYRLVLISIPGKKIARLSALSVSLFPSFYAYTIFPHKDMIVTFLILYLAYLTVKIYVAFSTDKIIKYASVFMFLFLLRTEAAIIMVGISFVYWIFKTKKLTVKLSGFIGVIVFLALLYPKLNQLNIVKGFQYEQISQDYTHVVAGQQAKSQGKSGIGNSIRSSSFVPRTVLGFMYILIKPFPPWSTMKNFDLSMLITFSSLFLIIIIPFWLKGLLIAWKKKMNKLYPSLLIMFGILLGTAIVYGAGPFRYRFQIMPFFLIFTVVGFTYNYKYKFIEYSYVTFFALSILGYLVIKL